MGVPLLILLLMGAPGGAAGAEICFFTHENLAVETPAAPRIGLVKPLITINQISTGGVAERMEEWCEAGCSNVVAAFKGRFGEKAVVIVPEDLDSGLKEEVEDIQALFDIITITIGTTWSGPAAFPKENRRFDYSVGDIRDLLSRLGVDILVFVQGLDQIRTGGRTAFEVFAFVGGVMYTKFAYMEAGLVSPSGSLLWYRMERQGSSDFRVPEEASSYLDAVLAGFPVR